MPSPDRPRTLSGFAEKFLGAKPAKKPVRYADVKEQAKRRKSA